MCVLVCIAVGCGIHNLMSSIIGIQISTIMISFCSILGTLIGQMNLRVCMALNPDRQFRLQVIVTIQRFWNKNNFGWKSSNFSWWLVCCDTRSVHSYLLPKWVHPSPGHSTRFEWNSVVETEHHWSEVEIRFCGCTVICPSTPDFIWSFTFCSVTHAVRVHTPLILFSHLHFVQLIGIVSPRKPCFLYNFVI